MKCRNPRWGPQDITPSDTKWWIKEAVVSFPVWMSLFKWNGMKVLIQGMVNVRRSTRSSYLITLEFWLILHPICLTVTADSKLYTWLCFTSLMITVSKQVFIVALSHQWMQVLRWLIVITAETDYIVRSKTLDRMSMDQLGLTTYHTLGRIMTGHSIRKLRIFAVPITWGNYNHGVIHDEVKKQQ